MDFDNRDDPDTEELSAAVQKLREVRQILSTALQENLSAMEPEYAEVATDSAQTELARRLHEQELAEQEKQRLRYERELAFIREVNRPTPPKAPVPREPEEKVIKKMRTS